MLKIYYKKAKDETIQELSEVRDGCWIHVDEATTSDLEELSEITKIDYADLLDCLGRVEERALGACALGAALLLAQQGLLGAFGWLRRRRSGENIYNNNKYSKKSQLNTISSIFLLLLVRDCGLQIML